MQIKQEVRHACRKILGTAMIISEENEDIRINARYFFESNQFDIDICEEESNISITIDLTGNSALQTLEKVLKHLNELGSESNVKH